MKACILAIGSEMLTPFRVDTNSLKVTERLNAVGYDVRFKAVVADDVNELATVVKAALVWADLVVITGGLGPTEDDVTRDAVSAALGLQMSVDETIVGQIRDRFVRRGMTMPEINRRQAMVPHGAVVLPNANGTAPGLWLESGGAGILLLPGPPREMTPMLEVVIADRLAPKSNGAGLFRRVLKITGRAESDVDAQAAPIYGKWASLPSPISTTILAVLGQIELHLTVRATNPGEADRLLEPAVRELHDVLGTAVYSTDGQSLEAVVGGLLREGALTIAAAESCTGGLLMSRLTDVPGSSAYVERGVVCYSNRAKTELAGVPETLILEHGAVSEPVARSMAEGIRSRAGTSIGVGITGIAGPGGGTPEKPVGTVAVAVASDKGSKVRTFRFVGGREMVKFQAAQSALNMTRLLVSDVEGEREWAERERR
ncbi:MAG TPA: competence/damage-inducible protein A [Vicinamibacterales bacterium]|jgi:nicotinamide-nucleotide amidase